MGKGETEKYSTYNPHSLLIAKTYIDHQLESDECDNEDGTEVMICEPR